MTTEKIDSLARAVLAAAQKEITICAECEKGEKCGASKPDSVFCSEFKRKEKKCLSTKEK